MKRMIALLLVIALACGCMVSTVAEDEQPEEHTVVPEEVILQEDVATEEEPAEQPAEEATESPAEDPAEKLAEEPEEEPAKEPAEDPAEEPVEEPAEKPAEESAEEPVEAPTEEPVEEPAVEPAEAPMEEPAEEPAEEPVEAPTEEPAEEPAEESAEEHEEEFKPDRTMNVGEEADGTLIAGKDYVIRLQGISGDIWIEAEASFVLKMTVTDEENGQIQIFRGSADAPLVASLNGQAGRTYLLSIGAENGFTVGPFHIQTSRADEPAAEEAPEPEQKDGDGALADNSTPKTETAAVLAVPTIKKITQKNDSVTVTWKAVSGALKYRIYCKKGSGSWKLLANLNGQKKTSYTHSTKVTPSTSGNTFQYRVCAIGENSAKSKYAVQTITRLASPGTVTVKKHSTAEDLAVVTWEKVKGATKYYVYYRRTGQENFKMKKVSADKTKTTIPVTGTRQNEVYVAAYAAGGSRGAKSATKKITPYWYRVLLVGDYDYPGTDDDRPGNRFDALELTKLFKKQTSKVTTVYNASATTIENKIISTFSGASSNTVCVFVYSGHGCTDYDSYWSGALACSDGSSWSYIPPSTLKWYLDNYGTKHNVVLLGSCGSGGMINSNGGPGRGMSPEEFNSGFISAFQTPVSNAGDLKDTHYSVITAAAPHQVEWIYWWWDTPGHFINGGTEFLRGIGRAGGYYYCDTSGINHGWTGKKGDTNGDKKISVKEAYQYAKPLVTRSTVQFWSSESGLILFP